MRIVFFGLLTLLALQGCSTSGNVERDLIIAPAPVACAGAPSATCLQVTEPSGDKWLMRFDEIDGFTYEPGFTYEVEVAEPPLKDELAVTPRLALVSIVSKQPGGGVPSELGHGAWHLVSLSGSDQDWSASPITASFHGGGWVDGFAGCNTYIAALTVEGQDVTISTPTPTGQPCPEPAHERERTYLAALAKAKSYTRTADTLQLTLTDDATMRFAAPN